MDNYPAKKGREVHLPSLVRNLMAVVAGRLTRMSAQHLPPPSSWDNNSAVLPLVLGRLSWLRGATARNMAGKNLATTDLDITPVIQVDILAIFVLT